MSQDQSLMPWKDEANAKQAQLVLAGDAITFPVTASALAQEMRDQSDIKKPARTAILRKTSKQLKVLHKTRDKLTSAQEEQYRFSAFILWVDAQVAGRHLDIRAGTLDAQDEAEALVAAL